MAHTVVWLPEAIDDLDGIAAYISADSPAYGSSLIKRSLQTVRRLADFPLLGTMVPEWEDPAIRPCVIYNYRMIYRVQPEVVEILAVIHGARLLPDDVRRR
jgi:addiction module RelE/StbE family toxin